MADCIRFSDAEIIGKEVWYVSDDKWIPMKDIQGKGTDACRDACISEPDCRVWRYNHKSGQCDLSAFEVEDVSATSDDYTSGRLRCAAEYDMLKIAIYLAIIAFIFVLWWYLTRPCKK